MGPFLSAWHEEVVELVPDRVRRARNDGTSGQKAFVREIDTGDTTSLSRPIIPAPEGTGSPFTMKSWHETHDVLDLGFDRWCLECHGTDLTHIDAPGHILLASGTSASSSASGVEVWAGAGLRRRAVFLDVPAIRGTPWVEIGDPVTAEDLDAAEEHAGTDVRPRDAVMLYMGRDRFERAGNSYPTAAASLPEGRSGVGTGGARWLAERGVSLVAWDFLDAVGPDTVPMSVHSLVPLLGLILVDNCHLGAAREILEQRRRSSGALVVAPLWVDGASGSPVNPLLML